MTEVERFFRRLVSNLAATDPDRLDGPVPLEDVLRDILPYRGNRKALQLDTSEDYEMVLLRLCAGEGGLVQTEPEEARSRFVQEIRSPNPDLHVLHSFENVQITFRQDQLDWALAPAPEPPQREPEESSKPDVLLGAAQFDELPGVEDLRPPPKPTRKAPPPEAIEEPDEPEGQELVETAEMPATQAGPICRYCGGALPANRTVNFCPRCGQNQTQILCPECRSEVEPGWRHCVNCGAAVGQR